MKTEVKINRKFLIFLMYLEVSKRKIADLFQISTRSLYTYLQNFPISENELQSLTFDREILEEVAMNCFDENSENNPIQKSFRLPESSVQKQKANLAEKIKLKTTEIKSSKNCNEEPKQIEDDDVSFLMQQSNNLAKQAEKFNK